MASFLTIELTDGSEWACNREREGIFSRRPDGTWQQHTGTGQTPRFRDASHMSRYLHQAFRSRTGEPLPPMRRGSARGW